jgi:hypothetical protein
MATDAIDLEVSGGAAPATTYITQLHRHFIGAYVVDLSTAVIDVVPHQRELDLNHVESIKASLVKYGILHGGTNVLDAILYDPTDPDPSSEVLQNIRIGVFSGQHRVSALRAVHADQTFEHLPHWATNLYRPSTYTTE